ncbi:MAG: S-methyl-5-thioribose-1-phosphate isomerase [Alphaproteobacteria bacterium]|jgi:methylthioribose-1-phosphate isomerase|nr:S-methyl-5-thioribose-1-phosphate isomerase [Alphaproteobacteria bacterium]
MKVDGVHYRSIWLEPDGATVGIIDQTRLPYSFETLKLSTKEQAAHAIRTMQVRGAPLIGATAAYGLALAVAEDPSDGALEQAVTLLAATRPTAVNLFWALERARREIAAVNPADRRAAAYQVASDIAEDDVATCAAIGRNGLGLIRAAAEKRGGKRINILTHCNAGWLATVDWGTALAPIYLAHDEGFDVHVWVDETRPRSQGASLTAWELGRHGVAHTVIADNAGGHLMQHGEVDLCIVGTDRTTANGDVCNKIGTYLKALAAYDNGVPFYVGLPHSTIDWTLTDGVRQIPIEERAETELTEMTGKTRDGRIETIRVVAEGSKGGNPAFDVTPARLVTRLITERGVCEATTAGLAGLYPERAAAA